VDLEIALAARQGAARREHLRADGVTDRDLDRAVRERRVLRVGRGGYALPNADPALVAAVAVRGVVSHASAARLHGLDLHNRPKLIDVTVSRGHTASWRNTRIHRASLGPAEQGTRIPVTSLLRTLEDCARTLPLAQAVIILDSALRNREVTHERLRAMARTARGPGSAKLRRAVAHADELAGSALESRLRLLLGLVSSDVRSQAHADGVGDVDFLVDGWLTVEGDGYEFHRSREDYRNDRRRGNLLVVGGSPVLRFSWEDVFLRPWVVLAQVEAVLAQRVKQTSQS